MAEQANKPNSEQDSMVTDTTLNYEAEYQRLVVEYRKLVDAFNKLLNEYNELHIKVLVGE